MSEPKKPTITTTDDNVVVVGQGQATWGLDQPQPDPLTTLRADVERLRDEADAGRQNAQVVVHRYWNRGGLPGSQMVDRYQFEERKWTHRADAYRVVLDLIDKREGK